MSNMQFKVGDKVKVDFSSYKNQVSQKHYEYWHNKIVTLVASCREISAFEVNRESFHGGRAYLNIMCLCPIEEQLMLFEL